MSEREPETITKKELVNRIADSTKQTKVVVKEIVQRFLDEVIAELAAGNRLEFRDFGVFEVKGRAARRAQNPRTLQKVQVPAKRVVKFKVGRVLRERISEEPEELPRSPRAAATPAPVQPPKPQPPTPPTPKPPPSNSPF
jgi:integration host factor subunit beta